LAANPRAFAESRPGIPIAWCFVRLLAEGLARLQALKPGHQDEALAVAAHADRHLEALFDDAFGDGVDGLGAHVVAPLGRDVDLVDPDADVIHRGF
jgi:hypothetical protein